MGGEPGRKLPSLFAPWPLFLGVAASFLACVGAGRALRAVNCYDDFHRFHLFVSEGSLHYPTVGHVRALARSRFDAGRVNVVVGGNSVLFGCGCGDADLWTARLQELLGDDYRVLNLALPGCWPHEFGGVAAEVLLRDYPRLIFVSNYFGVPDEPVGVDGRAGLRYFFWEARRQGRLLPNPDRDARLRELARERQGEDWFPELRSRVALDDVLGFRDLWTAAECKLVSTTWSAPVGATWWRPRGAYANPEVTLERPFPEEMRQVGLRLLRAQIAGQDAYLKAQGPPPAPPGETWRWLAWSLKACLAEDCRRRTVMLVSHWRPDLVRLLGPAERALYFEQAAAAARGMEQLGMTTLEVGKDYPDEDYLDCVHLSRPGHRRLAEDVAPRVRELAARLGYTRPAAAGQGGGRGLP